MKRLEQIKKKVLEALEDKDFDGGLNSVSVEFDIHLNVDIWIKITKNDDCISASQICEMEEHNSDLISSIYLDEILFYDDQKLKLSDEDKVEITKFVEKWVENFIL
mgnify:CR=1 FL=1